MDEVVFEMNGIWMLEIDFYGEYNVVCRGFAILIPDDLLLILHLARSFSSDV